MGMGRNLIGLYDLYNERVELRGNDEEEEDIFIPLDEDGEAKVYV